MKTRQLAVTLGSLAAVADTTRGDQLRALARLFGDGADETVAARIKKFSPATAYPDALRACLASLLSAFRAAGAAKQAADIQALLKVFVGNSGASVDEFIHEISIPRPKAKRSTSVASSPNLTLAGELADELSRTVLDEDAFSDVVRRLKVAKTVNTATLAAVANRFLGTSKRYTGRKAAVDDILQRHTADVREQARGRALSRVGV
jgi:hypothetical protein